MMNTEKDMYRRLMLHAFSETKCLSFLFWIFAFLRSSDRFWSAAIGAILHALQTDQALFGSYTPVHPAKADLSLPWGLFHQALGTDLNVLKRETTSDDIHLGAMGGMLGILQRYYLGIYEHMGGWHLDSALPKKLGRARLRLLYRSNKMELTAAESLMPIRAKASDRGNITFISRAGRPAMKPCEQFFIECPQRCKAEVDNWKRTALPARDKGEINITNAGLHWSPEGPRKTTYDSWALHQPCTWRQCNKLSHAQNPSPCPQSYRSSLKVNKFFLISHPLYLPQPQCAVYKIFRKSTTLNNNGRPA
jgi:hypothetical protein